MNRALYNISVARLIAINEQAEIDDKKHKKKLKKEVTQQVTEAVTQQVTEAVTQQVTEAVTQQVTEAVKIKAIERLLSLGKLSIQDIADAQDMDVSYVLKIKAAIDTNNVDA